MAPKKKKGAATGSASGPHLKKAKLGGDVVPIWEWKDGAKWNAFNPEDAAMLELAYSKQGPKGKFTTTEFTFNVGYDTLYEINFAKMTQTNKSTSKTREMRRSEPVIAKKAIWEWWNDDDEWQEYVDEDAALLEKAFAEREESPTFMTKALSFNKGYDSLYIYDFKIMTQVNSDSGTSRKIQRTKVGGSKIFGHTKGDDDDYAEVLAHMDTAASTTTLEDFSAEFDLGLPEALVKAQKKKGAASLRSQKKDYGPMVNKDAHGKKCFDEMLKNEEEFCGEWAVFYHSYSCAALMYEIQAAVGSVLFRFKSEFAALPRILYKPFKHIPHAERMLEEFPKWKDQDHNPAFKAVGLCGTSSLLADDAEAPAKSVFLMGYSVGSLGGVLEKLLGSCGVPKAKIGGLAKKIMTLAHKHGLDTKGIPGGTKCKSGRSGHMLQIFLRRELVDKFVYPAFPFGVPDEERNLPLSKYLTDRAPIQGQVRITLNPDVFLRANLARIFTYSADPTFHKNRPEFQKDLVGLLEPILGDEEVRTKAATGIFGGPPPGWWTAEDQGELAAMPASRYATSSM